MVEINEPLMLPAARSTAVALCGLGLSRLLGRPRTRVVSYAIENRDPTPRPTQAGLRRRLAHRLDLALARGSGAGWIGSPSAPKRRRSCTPTRLPGTQGPLQTLVWALPAPARRIGGQRGRARCIFLGAFTDRKGFSLLTRAWPLVRAARARGARCN